MSTFSPNGDAVSWWTFGSVEHDGVYAVAAHGARALAAGSFSAQIELAPPPFAGGLGRVPVGEEDAFVVHW